MMADYIDREALVERLTRNLSACNPGTFSERCYQDAINTVNFFPASDVAPVVHGRWVKQHIESVDSAEFSKCSVYNYPVSTMWNRTNYCPNCGAKMDGDGNAK